MSFFRRGLILGVAWVFCGLSTSKTADRMMDALEILKLTQSGRALVSRTNELWKSDTLIEVKDHLKWGQNSRTDTVLTRQYDPKTGHEEREREVTIYLRQDQAQIDLVLDLAHELVHAITRPSYDPYDPVLTPGKYIWAALEGPGGEVDAVITECEVGVELSKIWSFPLQRCQGYLKQSSQGSFVIDRERVRKDFYRVGKWKSKVVEKLKQEASLFPLLSSNSPQLLSSTGQAPYPAALLTEYEEITATACNNSRNRMTQIHSDKRKPFSASSTRFSTVLEKDDEIERFLSKRCEQKLLIPVP